MRLSHLLALSLFAAACGPRPDAPAAAPTSLSGAALDSVKAVDAAFAAGMNSKDTTAVFALYAADAKLMPPDSPALEGAAAHAFLGGFVAAGASDFALTPSTVYGVGDLAYVVGTATFTIGGASNMVKYTAVLRRGSDGKWRYVVDMLSGVAPPAAPAK